MAASVPIPKFANTGGTLSCELRNQRDTSKSMILVPLLNPKFAIGLPARLCELRVRGTGLRHQHANQHQSEGGHAGQARCHATQTPYPPATARAHLEFADRQSHSSPTTTISACPALHE